jgi:hypothetical protein
MQLSRVCRGANWYQMNDQQQLAPTEDSGGIKQDQKQNNQRKIAFEPKT